jgi:hypothetical protein
MESAELESAELESAELESAELESVEDLWCPWLSPSGFATSRY